MKPPESIATWIQKNHLSLCPAQEHLFPYSASVTSLFLPVVAAVSVRSVTLAKQSQFSAFYRPAEVLTSFNI